MYFSLLKSQCDLYSTVVLGIQSIAYPFSTLCSHFSPLLLVSLQFKSTFKQVYIPICNTMTGTHMRLNLFIRQ